MFEGMGLGGCILQAEYKFFKKSVMVFFFSVTTPFGIALGIALSSVYKENSPSSLITRAERSRRINDGEMADARAPASARAAALTEARGDARVRAQTEESRER
ncbi:hypothetical protein Scep_025653 [Stephania cephalantha]|uniref:Uncharacterized protein n=1 Tax=Stephania cephalantha TaxID=152367 RepID=A0AAP0HPJ9_9MAGN